MGFCSDRETRTAPNERPGFQWSGNLIGYGIPVLTHANGSRAVRQYLARISHTRSVAKDWHPAAGKTRWLNPSMINLAGGPEGETTSLAALNKRGSQLLALGSALMFAPHKQCQSQSKDIQGRPSPRRFRKVRWLLSLSRR